MVEFEEYLLKGFFLFLFFEMFFLNLFMRKERQRE